VSVAFLAAAVLLALERACYVWIARAPRSFRRWCARSAVVWLGEPLTVVRTLFVAFKLLQCAVFAGWCVASGGGFPTLSDSDAALGVGALLMLGGQMLSASPRCRRVNAVSESPQRRTARITASRSVSMVRGVESAAQRSLT
jgi:hypothetical protein